MTNTGAALLRWAPRIAGILVSMFLGLFALDAFDGRPLVSALPAFAIHLAPAVIVVAVVVLAWRAEWIGALAFIGLAIGYAVIVRGRLDLFLLSWRHRRALHPAA